MNNLKTTKSSISLFFYISIIGLLVNGIIRYDYIYLGGTIGEVSVTEITQSILLFITSSMFYKIGMDEKELKRVFNCSLFL